MLEILKYVTSSLDNFICSIIFLVIVIRVSGIAIHEILLGFRGVHRCSESGCSCSVEFESDSEDKDK